MTTVKEAPSLDPPGKGLPTFELWIARILVGWRARHTSREQTEVLFAKERAEILRIARLMDPADANKRMLIKRLAGMEDSSRYYSVWMTLDHLRICNDGAAEFISQLARGEMPTRVVTTAGVKPSPTQDIGIVESFQESCDQFEQAVARVPDLHTKLAWPHPWFGPLDGAKWHFFTAFHMGLHRRQIQAIAAALKRRP